MVKFLLPDIYIKLPVPPQGKCSGHQPLGFRTSPDGTQAAGPLQVKEGGVLTAGIVVSLRGGQGAAIPLLGRTRASMMQAAEDRSFLPLPVAIRAPPPTRFGLFTHIHAHHHTHTCT